MVFKKMSSTSNAPTFNKSCAVSIPKLKRMARSVTLITFFHIFFFEIVGIKKPKGIKHITFPTKFTMVTFQP